MNQSDKPAYYDGSGNLNLTQAKTEQNKVTVIKPHAIGNHTPFAAISKLSIILSKFMN